MSRTGLGWAAALCGLMAAWGLELWWTTAGSNPVPAIVAARPTALAAAEDRTPSYAATALARPLFAPTRRPPTGPAAPAVTAAAGSLPRLSGVIIAQGQARAIFQDGDHSVVGGVGSTVGAFRIVSVAAAAVTLSGPRGLETVRLAYGAAPPPAPVVAPSILEQLNSGRAMAPMAVPRPPTIAELMSRLPGAGRP